MNRMGLGENDSMEPEQLGPYRIVGTLGRGGMGTVYRGVNVVTEEPAAVKILSADLAREKDFRKRFEGEIETLRKLRHPNIVRLFGFGEQDGQLFYAMELVDGKSLEQELRGGRNFDWPTVVDIGVAMCLALRHAHDRGVIHRDIKPANLLLAADGSTKLSDFGIARLFGYSGLTAAGNVLGTIDYMSPEQADAKTVGPPSDLYSLGGVLYTLLARRPPFRARSLPEMLDKQRAAIAPSVLRYAPDTPADLDRIISRLLEKKPQRRFATALVLQRQLSALKYRTSLQDRRTAESEDEATEADFDLMTQATDVDSPAGSSLPITRAGDQLDVSGLPTANIPAVSGAHELPETKETSALMGMAGAGAIPGRIADGDADEAQKEGDTHATGSTGSFVAIDEEDLDRFETDEPTKGALISLQTWILVAGLVMIGAIVFFLMQNPSADELYHRIHAATTDGTMSSYRQAEDDINEFRLLYPEDARCEQLLKYLQKIELDRLEGLFERRAKGLVDAERLLPIERDYVEAITYLRFDSERGMAKLQALVDLYDSGSDASGPTGQCLALAKKRLVLLHRQSEIDGGDHLALVLHRLDLADELNQTDEQKARTIRRAVIELYQHKPWATEAVQRARQALDAAQKPSLPDKNEKP